MADINSAPAAIAAWEEMRARFEPLANALVAFVGDAVALSDSMGDFAIGGEADTAQVASIIGDEVMSAKEGINSYIARLEDEYAPSIEAASGKTADVHRVMQEA